MLIDNGYFANGGSQLALTLPLISAVGDTIKISSLNNNGWAIVQNAGQYIQFGVRKTTTGASGSLSSSLVGDSIEIVCCVPNIAWQLLDSMGNLTYV